MKQNSTEGELVRDMKIVELKIGFVRKRCLLSFVCVPRIGCGLQNEQTGCSNSLN